MSQPADLKGALLLLEQVLNQKKLAGHDTVSISSEGMSELERLPLTLMKSASGLSAAPVPQAAPSVAIAEVKTPSRPPKNEPVPERSAPVLENAYGDLAVKTEMRGRAEIIHPAGDTVRDKLNNLFRLAKKCDVCRGMGTLREQLVFAAGNPEAELMFVGESPRFDDEAQKKPFVGAAGKKLDQILLAMGLKRENVYFSNILKYRPKIGDGRFQGPKDRKPTPEEIAASLKFVRSEIEVIQPKVIVALGSTAAEGLLEKSGSVSSLRGQFFQIDKIPVSVTYHPSYLLRLESETDLEMARQEKRKVWEDALAVMEKLEMPISDKQRGFFNK